MASVTFHSASANSQPMSSDNLKAKIQKEWKKASYAWFLVWGSMACFCDSGWAVVFQWTHSHPDVPWSPVSGEGVCLYLVSATVAVEPVCLWPAGCGGPMSSVSCPQGHGAMDGAGLGRTDGTVGAAGERNCRGRWKPSPWNHRAGVAFVAQMVAREATEEPPFELNVVTVGGGELVCRGREACGRDTGGRGLGDLCGGGEPKDGCQAPRG